MLCVNIAACTGILPSNTEMMKTEEEDSHRKKSKLLDYLGSHLTDI